MTHVPLQVVRPHVRLVVVGEVDLEGHLGDRGGIYIQGGGAGNQEIRNSGHLYVRTYLGLVLRAGGGGRRPACFARERRSGAGRALCVNLCMKAADYKLFFLECPTSVDPSSGSPAKSSSLAVSLMATHRWGPPSSAGGSRSKNPHGSPSEKT